MKKASLVVAAALLTASSFLGCGGAQSPAQMDNAAPPSAPPKLPPSMGGGGGAAAAPPAGGEMQQATHDAPSEEMARGMAALDRNDIAGAKASFQAMIKKDPKDADAYHFLGLVSEKEGKKADAEKAYKESLKLRPDLEASMVDLSALYIDQGKIEDALAVSRAGIAKHADSAPLHLNTALALAGKNDTGGASKEFDEAMRLAPKDAAVAMTYGHWLGVWKQPDAALTKLRAARPLAKEDVSMLAAIGDEMRAIGAFADCVPTFDKAISIRDAAELRTLRAICKMGAKDDAGARADLAAAVAKEPGFAPAHFYLAGRLAQSGQLKEGVAEYEAYLKLAPNGPMAKTAAERIKFAKDKMKK
jgi:Tfp pilus assembly protein PilF